MSIPHIQTFGLTSSNPRERLEHYLEEKLFGIKHQTEEQKKMDDEMGYNAKGATFSDMTELDQQEYERNKK